jgi:hypothetical protein
MTKASDNAFPSILITEGTEPAAPAAGKQRLYIDSTTHKLKRTDSSGTDVTIEAAAGAVASDTIWDAKGDLAAGTGADTASKLTVGTNQDILVANSAQSTGLQWVTLQVGRVVRSSGDFTHTGDTNFTDITGASITFTTGARRVALDFSASWYVNNATGTAGLDFVIDGTRPGGTTAGMTTYNQHATASEAVPVHIHYLTDVLSAGSHTFKVQAKVFNAAHTVTVQAADPVYVFCAEERPLG